MTTEIVLARLLSDCEDSGRGLGNELVHQGEELDVGLNLGDY